MATTLQEALNEKPQRLPKDKRKFEVINCVFEKSKEKNTPMFHLTLESKGNPVETVDGKPADPNGITRDKWIVITENNLRRLALLYSQSGIKDLSQVTLEKILAQPNPGMFIGKTLWCICETKLSPELKEDGVTKVLGTDGQPVIKANFEIGDIV